MRGTYNILVGISNLETLKRRENLENLGVDGKKLIK
jgi:hypothetical protein